MADKFFRTAVAALCVVLVGVAHAQDKAAAPPAFSIQGRIYCDNCRAGFETTVTEYIEGAKVKLECRNITTNEIIHTTSGVTDNTGTYKLQVADDRQDEICEVVLVHSPVPDCSEIKTGRDRARILLTDNGGMSSNVRFANSLGFLKAEPLPRCGDLLTKYALGEDD